MLEVPPFCQPNPISVIQTTEKQENDILYKNRPGPSASINSYAI